MNQQSAKRKMAAIKRRFGQEQPPLHVTIQKILNKYPDGQIFKVKSVDPFLL